MAILKKDYYTEENKNLKLLTNDDEKVVSEYCRDCNCDISRINKDEWPFFYYFSDLRKNIISWYSFKNDCSILEIGSNFGAFTDYLVEKAKRVISVDRNYYSALTNYNRNKDADNLEIVIGDIKNIKINEKFDYVILIDYIENDNYQSAISFAKEMLSKDGEILLNVDNKLGIKYLSGDNDNKCLFTRDELNTELQKNNLSINKWYYPFPDAKFPFEIFTDDSINVRKPISSFFAPIGKKEVMPFDYNKVYSSFIDNGIARIFVNSFFISVSLEKRNVDEYDYFKISSLRTREFSTCVKINSKEEKVSKTAIYSCGLSHIKSMKTNGGTLNGFYNIKQLLTNGGVQSILIKGDTLKDILQKEINNGNYDAIWMIFSGLKQKLYNTDKTSISPSSEFYEVFGYDREVYNMHWLEKANIDLVLENIFVKDNKYLSVDNEWTFNFKIPAEYILYRTFKYLDIGIKKKCNITGEEICNILEVDNKNIKTFDRWENHFLTKYVKVSEIPYCEYDTYDGIKYKYEQVINSNIWKYSRVIRETKDGLKEFAGKLKK